MGAVKKLILYESMDVQRVELRNNQANTVSVTHLTPEQMEDDANFIDKETGVELETIKKELLIEFFAENYKSFGCELEFITDRSQEGSQFCKGFGGIGGILRWAVDFGQMNEYIEQTGKEWDEESDDGGDDSSDVDEDYDPDGDFGF